MAITFCGFVSVCLCTRLQFTDKLNGQIAQNRCYKLAAIFIKQKYKNILFDYQLLRK